MQGISIGERLIHLRGDQSRETVASAVKVTPSAIAMYEQNRRTPRDHIKVALAKYYGVTVEELFFSA